MLQSQHASSHKGKYICGKPLPEIEGKLLNIDFVFIPATNATHTESIVLTSASLTTGVLLGKLRTLPVVNNKIDSQH
jgi:hypothetical protein